ncbi:MAG: XRE family transcriptional regulator [Bacteroidales bacterium]|nr:XRE family transcriptional regulator [Bacteroidales bacterium]
MNIGERIKEVMTQKQRGVTWLAKNLPCERSNVYYIFRRSSIDTELLQKLSKLLDHDFFKDLSEETFSKNK